MANNDDFWRYDPAPVHFIADGKPFTPPACGIPYPADGTGLTLSVQSHHVTCTDCLLWLADHPGHVQLTTTR